MRMEGGEGVEHAHRQKKGRRLKSVDPQQDWDFPAMGEEGTGGRGGVSDDGCAGIIIIIIAIWFCGRFLADAHRSN